MKQQNFIPAMHFHWLTPLFDFIARVTLPDRELKSLLIRHAALQAGYRVLDLCCGTATLALMIKQDYPDVAVVGLDIDPKILEIARRKMQAAGVEILLQQGTATQLPYADGSFDRVFVSFALHHLKHDDKRQAIAEVLRVLRPGGELHVLDFGKPDNFYCLLVSLVLRWVEELDDNIRGLLPEMMQSAGFKDIEEYARRSALFGTLSLFRARKP